MRGKHLKIGISRAPSATTSAAKQPLRRETNAGRVTVNEIIVLVNIALGSAEPAACAAGIPSGAHVDVALIIQAVNSTLNGCGG